MGNTCKFHGNNDIHVNTHPPRIARRILAYENRGGTHAKKNAQTPQEIPPMMWNLENVSEIARNLGKAASYPARNFTLPPP